MDANPAPSGKWRVVLETITTLSLLLAAIVVLWTVVASRPISFDPSRELGRVPKEPVSLTGAVVRGSRDAKAVLIQFSDFECPFCARFARETLPELLERYVTTGKYLFAFRHFPLDQLHRHARDAAAAAACAEAQGRFWEFHDLLFSGAVSLDRTGLRNTAKSLGLDEGSFDTCQSSANASINRAIELGRTLEVAGTPAFFVGTVASDGLIRVSRRISGARPLDEFKQAMDSVLSAANGRRNQ